MLPEGETDIVMSRGRVGRGYEQVGLDFVPGRDGVDLALPFNRHHLLFGRVPLKQPDQATFTFLKFENYGTEAFSDIGPTWNPVRTPCGEARSRGKNAVAT